jgi:hypothetical protein
VRGEVRRFNMTTEMPRKYFLLSLLAILPSQIFAQDVGEMSTSDLIETYVEIQDELKLREIVSSGNSLTGQLGEFIFINAFGWTPAEPNQEGFDALDGTLRIQIKARRQSGSDGDEQLGAIRDLEGFDVLAAVVFSHEYEIVEAALIPADVVRDSVDYVEHTNSWRLTFSHAVRQDPGVKDVSQILRSFEY